MNISKKSVLEANQNFDGNIRSASSIDFALSLQTNKKIGRYKKLAYLFRAILVDHPFTDGNKRTAAFIAIIFAEDAKKKIDKELLLHHIISIAKGNITTIKNIEWRLKNAIK